MNRLIRTLAAICAAGAMCLSSALGKAQQPNVILIMVDDLGYRDLGCYGHPSIKTPVLDKLAAGGMRLTNFHAGASVCTPSRMALLTGTYPVRLGWTQGVAGYLMGNKDGMASEALTVAEIFKSEGYTTGISGKWHIGRLPGTRPHEQGFDSAYYNPMSNNQLDEIWRGEAIEVKPTDNRLLTEQFTAEGMRFIRGNKEKPFFLYLPYTAPHFPVMPHPDWKGHSDFGDYGDVVEELDGRIGDILALLDELSIRENTIVIFISDNGPQGGEQASALPFRGKKWSALEGATRVPGIISWPGKIPAGEESGALIGAIDLLPTLCRAAGIDWRAKSKGKPPIDGMDVWDTFMGNAAGHPRSELLHWHGMESRPQAFTQGDWKVFLDRRNAFEGPGVAAGAKKRAKAEGLEAGKNSPKVELALFNVREDVDETDDLSLKHPEKVEALKARALQLIAELDSSEKLEIAKPH